MSLAVIGVVNIGWLEAQAPVVTAHESAVSTLPVRRVILYKSGVGYFEHLGRIRGTQNVTINFTSGQLDDVLASLTTLDLDGGRVLGVSYNSADSLTHQLGALHLPVDRTTSEAGLLAALRGARVEVGDHGARMTGRLLGVERTSRLGPSGPVSADVVSLVTDRSEVQTVALGPGVTVRILDAALRQEVGDYLSLVSASRNADERQLTIATSGLGDRDLLVSYISEVPVWKATYRIVLPAAGSAEPPVLEGWAIVDNTSALDWSGVKLALIAGAPQSFIQQMSRPLYVQRPVMPLPTQLLHAPQTHEAGLATGGVGVLSGTISDSSGAIVPGVTVTATRRGGSTSRQVSDATGRYHFQNLPADTYDLSASLSGFRTEQRVGLDVAGGMETVLNIQMVVGRVEEAVTVVSESPLVDTKRTAAGSASGQQLAARDPWQVVHNGPAYSNYDSFQEVGVGSRQVQWNLEGMSTDQALASGQVVGDLFEYDVRDPVTIRRNQSALVPIVVGTVEAVRVSVWNATDGGAHPLRAVWLTNATGQTIDAGSFSVVDGQTFAGQGLMAAFRPGDRRLISYASDTGVDIVSRSDTVPNRVTRVHIAHGVITQTETASQRVTYVIRNDDTTGREVVVEHPIHVGWTLAGSIHPDEVTTQWDRFRVAVAPKTTVNFVVEETRPAESQGAVSTLTDVQVGALVEQDLISATVAGALQAVLAQKGEVARLEAEVASRTDQIASIALDQQRVRDNLQALKGSVDERRLIERYVKQLDDQETQLTSLRKDLTTLTAGRTAAEARLAALIEAVATPPGGGGPSGA